MRSDLEQLVDGLVRDEVARLSAPDKQMAIDLAVIRYGTDRPRRKVEDVVGGGNTLPLPTAWEAESSLLSAEYPIGDIPPALLACAMYSTPTGDLLRLDESLPAGAEVRLTFAVSHVVSDTVDTVLPGHREAVACWAAALLLEQLAAAAINDGESSMAADSTDRRTKAQEYGARARALKTRYSEVMGRGSAGSGQAASGAAVAWPSRQRLTRGIRRRE